MGNETGNHGGIMGFTLRKRPDVDDISIVSSITTTRKKSTALVPATNWNSDTSSSSSDEEHICPSEFVIECKDGEMIFVNAFQSRQVQAQCHAIRHLLATGVKEGDGRIVQRPDWMIGNVRQLIELLSFGETWVENDASAFQDLYKVTKDAVVDARLCSLVNFHDMLSKDSTEKFFKMLKLENYQFKIRVAVSSSQWKDLMKRGTLLLLKTKVLMVKLVPQNRKESRTRLPTEERLRKCDTIASEFCVYGNGGKINSLLKIINTLTTAKQKQVRNETEEEFKLVFHTSGHLSDEDLEILWRCMSCTYTLSPAEERIYLQSQVKEAILDLPDQKVDHIQCRTMTGTSFMALKQLFESISKKNQVLPACLLVTAPTPDTLGRLINAAQNCGGTDINFDLDHNAYFVCGTTGEIQVMLEYMGNYSSSAVVKGDFSMRQFKR